MDNVPAEKSPFANLIQIGVVVKDMERTIERLSILGVGPFYSKMPPKNAESLYRGKPFVSAERVNIKACQLGNVELELVQPLEGGSPHREYLEEKGEGIQHIAFAVNDLRKATEALTDKGCTVLLKGERKDGGGVAYIDLAAGGITVELVKH
jgi:methylmalonyl-CoA/ethylmalonyl-CoA epimerase